MTSTGHTFGEGLHGRWDEGGAWGTLRVSLVQLDEQVTHSLR